MKKINNKLFIKLILVFMIFGFCISAPKKVEAEGANEGFFWDKLTYRSRTGNYYCCDHDRHLYNNESNNPAYKVTGPIYINDYDIDDSKSQRYAILLYEAMHNQYADKGYNNIQIIQIYFWRFVNIPKANGGTNQASYYSIEKEKPKWDQAFEIWHKAWGDAENVTNSEFWNPTGQKESYGNSSKAIYDRNTSIKNATGSLGKTYLKNDESTTIDPGVSESYSYEGVYQGSGQVSGASISGNTLIVSNLSDGEYSVRVKYTYNVYQAYYYLHYPVDANGNFNRKLSKNCRTICEC